MVVDAVLAAECARARVLVGVAGVGLETHAEEAERGTEDACVGG